MQSACPNPDPWAACYHGLPGSLPLPSLLSQLTGELEAEHGGIIQIWENIKVSFHLGVAWRDPVVTMKDALGGQVYSGLSPIQPSHE